MSVGNGQTGLLALWSAPRSRSTAFFRVMAERGDVVSLHEPFAQVVDRGETELPGHSVTSIDELIDRLLDLAERTVVFLKDTTDKRQQRVLERPDFLRSGRQTFLIRDPREVIASYCALRPDMQRYEVGVENLAEIFAATTAAGGSALVLDSDDFVDRPAETTAAYCAAVGLPFRPKALSWEAGDRVEWRSSAAWHAGVRDSTTVERRTSEYERTVDTDPALRAMYNHHAPFYEELRRHRVRLQTAADGPRHAVDP